MPRDRRSAGKWVCLTPSASAVRICGPTRVRAIIVALILVLGGDILTAILSLPLVGVMPPALVGVKIGSDVAVPSGQIDSRLRLVMAIPIWVILSGVPTS